MPLTTNETPVILSPAEGPLTQPLSAITGTAGPGSTVSISIDGGPPTNVTAAADGKWSWPVTTQPPPGPHTVSARSGAVGERVVSFTVPAPLPSSSLVIISPQSGALPGPLVEIAGTASPNTDVNVSIDGAEPVAVRSDSAGRWRWPVTTQPPPGSHSVSAKSGTQITSVAFVAPALNLDTGARPNVRQAIGDTPLPSLDQLTGNTSATAPTTAAATASVQKSAGVPLWVWGAGCVVALWWLLPKFVREQHRRLNS